MSYDRMGRRVTKNAQRFVYNGCLQIADNVGNVYAWDCTEPVATRPLVWNFSTVQPFNSSTFFYTHDGNKNVSEVIASDGSVAAHYDYAPFGAVTVSNGAEQNSGSPASIHCSLLPIRCLNPWRFSSEFADDELGCDYYNYREYEPVTGRWMQRDPMEENGGVALYCNSYNRLLMSFDCVGLNGSRPKIPFFDESEQMPRLIYALVKTIKEGPTKTGENTWRIHVRFVPRFTPPEPFWSGRANMPKCPIFLAGSKWGTDDDMWKLPHGAVDLTDKDWGKPDKKDVGKTMYGSPLYRYDFSKKMFRYGWYLYVRDVGGEWSEENSNDDMYTTWTTATPGHFLPSNDEHVETTLQCCQEALVIHGDKGSKEPSVEGVFKTPCPRM